MLYDDFCLSKNYIKEQLTNLEMLQYPLSLG